MGPYVDGSYLFFGVIDGYFDNNGKKIPFLDVELKENIRLNFSFNDEGVFGWRDKVDQDKFYTSKEITDIWIESFFKQLYD